MRRYNWRNLVVATQYSLFPSRREGVVLPEDPAPAPDSVMSSRRTSPFESAPRALRSMSVMKHEPRKMPPVFATIPWRLGQRFSPSITMGLCIARGVYAA